MAIEIKEMKRVFIFDDIRLDDPDPNFTETQVLDFYSNTYPEMNVGYISDRKTNTNTAEQELTISVSVGKNA